MFAVFIFFSITFTFSFTINTTSVATPIGIPRTRASKIPGSRNEKIIINQRRRQPQRRNNHQHEQNRLDALLEPIFRNFEPYNARVINTQRCIEAKRPNDSSEEDKSLRGTRCGVSVNRTLKLFVDHFFGHEPGGTEDCNGAECVGYAHTKNKAVIGRGESRCRSKDDEYDEGRGEGGGEARDSGDGDAGVARVDRLSL